MSTKQLISNQAAKMRGVILNDVIYLERIIDVYLSCYFSNIPDKRDEIIDLVFAASGGMPFDPKRNIFATLFKKHNKEFFQKNKGYFEDLSFVIKQRNVFAHYILDTSEEAQKRFLESKEIGFIKFKEVTETVWFSKDNFNDILVRLKSCVEISKSLLPEFDENGNPLS